MNEKTLLTLRGSDTMVYIILVNYNGYIDTIECIESLIKMVNIEVCRILIVDNNSTDTSYQILDKKYKQNKYVEILKAKENNGFSAGNNIGIEYAFAQNNVSHIWLLNNDTTVDRFCLENLLLTSSQKNNSIFGTKIYNYNKKNIIDFYGGYIKDSFYNTGHMFDGEVDNSETAKAIKVDWLTGCSLFAKKDIFEKVKLDEKYFLYEEDLAFSLDAKKQNIDLWVIPNAHIYHKGSASTGKVPFSTKYYIHRNKLLIVAKYATIMAKIFFFTTSFIRSFFKISRRFIAGYILGNEYRVNSAKAELKAIIDFINNKTGKM